MTDRLENFKLGRGEETMARAQERTKAVAEAVARIRAAEAEQGVTREGLAAIRDELLKLATQRELFTLDDFPPPAPGGDDNSALYLLSEDAARRFALYLQSCLPEVDVPPHNHTTWACIVGLQGVEQNRFYERRDDGPTQSGGLEVGPGVGVAFLPEDLHSIHIHGAEPVLNFHMYGRSLETLDARECWSAKEGRWKVFPPQEGIIDRRGA
jgi:predicted metal-dependent enzyme (double-stranded beta helix superfamily)